MQTGSSPANVLPAEPEVLSFYDPRWLGFVVGMKPCWTGDLTARQALKTCAWWTRGSSDELLRTRLGQVYTLLQDVRRNYHADRLEKTERFRRVGSFRDVVKRLYDEREGELWIPDDAYVVREFQALGGAVRDMVRTEMRMRLGMSWYRAQWPGIQRFLEQIKDAR